MPLPAERVAVIGAGISGVCTAAHLLKLGLGVVVFERSEVAGGVWHFDPRVPADPAYPSEDPSIGDYQVIKPSPYSTLPFEAGYSPSIEIKHAPPSPCYAGLKNNVSTPLMRTSLLPWPEETEDFVSQGYLEKYIQTISRRTGVHEVTRYNTRVEEVKAHDSRWTVRALTLTKPTAEDGQYTLSHGSCTFDAVVVASGHYNAARVPDFPGLAEWKHRFPNRVSHSKSYRSAELYRNKNVLLVGAGVSSNDIAKEVSSVGARVIQSSRGGLLDLPIDVLPKRAIRIGQILSFDLDSSSLSQLPQLPDDEPIPGSITAHTSPPSMNATESSSDTLTLSHEIHYVILCTGYMVSYPFLNKYHCTYLPSPGPTSSSSSSSSSSISTSTDSDQYTVGRDVLTTPSGTTVHNLYRDTFFIAKPSLAFVGTPYHIATFSLFDFQAQAVARVFAGVAELPSETQMQDSYRHKVRAKGLGRHFHSLRGEGEEERFVRELVEWVNGGLVRLGAGRDVYPMEGHTEEWRMADIARRERLRWVRGK